MADPVTSINQEPVPLAAPDAMSIVAADRLRQHEKIVRLRALREAAEVDKSSTKEEE